jgi:hypothetical protein
MRSARARHPQGHPAQPASRERSPRRASSSVPIKLYFTIGDAETNQLANFCNPNRAQSLPTVEQVRMRDWSLYQGKIRG